MHGFENADPAVFSFLIGKEVNQIAIGPYDVQIHFGTGTISIWSKFLLRVQDGLEFEWVGEDPGKAKELVTLVTSTIVDLSFSAESMVLKFSNGCELSIFDPNPRHESLSISEKGRSLIVI